MNTITIAIGVVALLFGIFTMVVRVRRPEQYTKLKAMQDKLGDKPGYTVHLIAYSVVPMVFGAIMILAGVNGISFF